MKINHLLFSLIIFLSGLGYSYGQRCHNFHKSKDCAVENHENLELSSLSRSYYLEEGKTVTYEVVLYGQKEFMIQCCTEEEYYPLRFRLLSSVNGDIIYDNKNDNYTNSINLSLDKTELISIEISFVSNNKKSPLTKGTKACIGMAIFMEKNAVRN